MKKNIKSKNALLIIPKRNEMIEWECKNNLIILNIKRDKSYDKILHKIFKTPLIVNVELDELGSFVWQKCDGVKNINEISQDMKDYFGSKAEPVLNRLIEYIKTLYNNKFIYLE